ncbi:hypothetical protein [Streptomyces sp. NBC_01092]|uniref:hypothetical protein n=1 Tax=Streptomyces sp. NBC_01092 TaxID=2903748 RepID=UPI00386381C8|nr:hypothetical protein OG254_38680 [Streptomyces sp. NBC_01092]
MTDTERKTAQARTAQGPPDTAAGAASRPKVTVPAYAADPCDHEALLDDFLTENGDWEKYRTWEDSTTVANHESLPMRALFDHDAEGRDIKWIFAVYETPVSDLWWHGTATASTPNAIVSTLLNSVATGNPWDRGPSNSIAESAIAQAAQPLADADWEHTIDGRYITWEAHGPQAAGAQFDTFAAQQPAAYMDNLERPRHPPARLGTAPPHTPGQPCCRTSPSKWPKDKAPAAFVRRPLTVQTSTPPKPPPR